MTQCCVKMTFNFLWPLIYTFMPVFCLFILAPLSPSCLTLLAPMERQRLRGVLSSFLFSIVSILRSIFSGLPEFSAIFVTLSDKLLSLHFRLCNMSPCTIDLDDKTTVQFWVTNHRKFNKPTLVLIHGYGGHSLWQFRPQVGPLSREFNLCIPDLLFFGKSYTHGTERSVEFQAKCVGEGLRKLGLEKYSIVGLSYGGYVTYHMADKYKEEVEKVVIVSSGICYTEKQKEEYIKNVGGNICDFLLPQKPEHVRGMMRLAMYKNDPLKWWPDFVLRQFIHVMTNTHRQEKSELLDYLLARKADEGLPTITQETLLIWGDKDMVFPVELAYQLQGHLGSKSRVEIIKDTGHAANIESPDAVNNLITSFLLGQSS